MSDDDDRSERLRQRRNRSKEKASGTSEPDEQPEPTELSEDSRTSELSEPSKTQDSEDDSSSETDESSKQSVKSELVGTYMYLREDVDDELGREYKRLDFELDEHLDVDFEKNRDFYNLIVELGLDRARELDSEKLAERVQDARTI